MIELRRPPASNDAGTVAADAVAAELGEMVVAHRVIEDPTLDGPALVDGATTAEGPDAIAAFLTELRGDLDDWGRFQSDACYLDEEGRVC